jgi:O-antigen/teichoic acid export membrane protein
MVVASISKVVMIFTHGFEAAFGNMIAQNEKRTLRGNFNLYDLIASSVTVIFFTTAGLLINPFIRLYTNGITDVNYSRELFAYILLISEAVYCIRQPYHTVIVAAGHFKQTQSIAYLEAGTNILLSVLLVLQYGIVGVAIGTLVAMSLRAVLIALYLRKNILYRGFRVFVMRQIITVANAAAIIFAVRMIYPSLQFHSYLEFCQYGVVIVGIAFVITALFDCSFYRRDVLEVLYKAAGLLRRRK